MEISSGTRDSRAEVWKRQRGRNEEKKLGESRGYNRKRISLAQALYPRKDLVEGATPPLMVMHAFINAFIIRPPPVYSRTRDLYTYIYMCVPAATNDRRRASFARAICDNERTTSDCASINAITAIPPRDQRRTNGDAKVRNSNQRVYRICFETAINVSRILLSLKNYYSRSALRAIAANTRSNSYNCLNKFTEYDSHRVI